MYVITTREQSELVPRQMPSWMTIVREYPMGVFQSYGNLMDNENVGMLAPWIGERVCWNRDTLTLLEKVTKIAFPNILGRCDE